MLNILFSETNREIAEKIQRDLQSSPIKFTETYHIVVVTSASVADDEVLQAISKIKPQERVVVCWLDDVPLPDSLQSATLIDMRDGYRGRKLNGILRRLEVGEERVGRNNLMLAVIGALALVVFVVALLSIASGQVVFPVAEYATENAANQAMIDSLLLPTLEAFQPRSTQDALNFPATLQAAPTRVAPYLERTATALPRSVSATLEAIETSAAATMTADAPSD